MQNGEHTYTISTFWSLIDAVDWLAGVVVPFLFLAGSIYWIRNSRSLASTTSLVGSIVLVVSMLTAVFFDELGNIYFGHLQPLYGDNQVIWFFQYFGSELGFTIVAIAFFLYFRSKVRAHNQQIN